MNIAITEKDKPKKKKNTSAGRRGTILKNLNLIPNKIVVK
jgi:hypothetical protein